MVPITQSIPYAFQTIDNNVSNCEEKNEEEEEEENGRGDTEDRKAKRKNSNQNISWVLNVVEDKQHTIDEKKKKR